MSEQISFDRKKGFVALPVEVLDFDLTPGAFRTLAELCRMANADGYCWPSLEQLSERLGRSRSAISGYIKELRDTELVSTQQQKTANGYNYRLKYQVTFWQAWRASLKPVPARQSEHRVQPDKRLIESKKQSHKNQPGGAEHSAIDRLLKGWTKCFAGAPYPLVSRAPTADQERATNTVLGEDQNIKLADRKEIDAGLSKLWADLNLDVSRSDHADHLKALTIRQYTAEELAMVIGNIRKNWPTHWRKGPSPEAFEKLIKAAGVQGHHSKLSLLRSYQKRWQRAENSLHRTAASCSVAA